MRLDFDKLVEEENEWNDQRQRNGESVRGMPNHRFAVSVNQMMERGLERVVEDNESFKDSPNRYRVGNSKVRWERKIMNTEEEIRVYRYNLQET